MNPFQRITTAGQHMARCAAPTDPFLAKVIVGAGNISSNFDDCCCNVGFEITTKLLKNCNVRRDSVHAPGIEMEADYQRIVRRFHNGGDIIGIDALGKPIRRSELMARHRAISSRKDSRWNKQSRVDFTGLWCDQLLLGFPRRVRAAVLQPYTFVGHVGESLAKVVQAHRYLSSRDILLVVDDAQLSVGDFSLVEVPFETGITGCSHSAIKSVIESCADYFTSPRSSSPPQHEADDDAEPVPFHQLPGFKAAKEFERAPAAPFGAMPLAQSRHSELTADAPSFWVMRVGVAEELHRTREVEAVHGDITPLGQGWHQRRKLYTSLGAYVAALWAGNPATALDYLKAGRRLLLDSNIPKWEQEAQRTMMPHRDRAILHGAARLEQDPNFKLPGMSKLALRSEAANVIDHFFFQPKGAKREKDLKPPTKQR